METVFGPVLRAVFAPLNAILGAIPFGVASFVAIAYFVGTMVWIWTLNKSYVNRQAPSAHFWHDLRFWVIVSMLPHVIVYFYFR